MQDEEEITRIPRKKKSRTNLNSCVIEDDDQVLKTIESAKLVEKDDDDWVFDMYYGELRRKQENITQEEIDQMKAKSRAAMDKWRKEHEKEYEEREREFRRKYPPLYSREQGVVDSMDACVIEFDGLLVKSRDEYEYRYLVIFAVNCQLNRALQLYTHPGDPRMGGVDVIESEELVEQFYIDLADLAISEYNKYSKKANLMLEQLTRVNHVETSGSYYYMTFSAIDEQTGKSDTYQAALSETCGGYLLGQFRHVSSGKVLAILSLTGAESDIVHLRDTLLNNSATADYDV